MLLGMASNVAFIAAVAVILSLGHSPSQTGVSVRITTGLAVKVGKAVGVSVAGSTAGPQATKRFRIRLVEAISKILVNFLFIPDRAGGN